MKTHTTPEQPTAYGFRCGYTQTIGFFRIEWESCCYHIKGVGRDGVRLWQSATTLADARRIARMLNKA